MKISLLLIGLLWRFSTLAQPITGRWEAEEVSLEITSILNYGIVAMKQPRQATKPAKIDSSPNSSPMVRFE